MVVVKSKTGEPKIFYIGWSGTEDFRPVVAINGKQAREKFANYHNVNLSSYCSGEKPSLLMQKNQRSATTDTT